MSLIEQTLLIVALAATCFAAFLLVRRDAAGKSCNDGQTSCGCADVDDPSACAHDRAQTAPGD